MDSRFYGNFVLGHKVFAKAGILLCSGFYFLLTEMNSLNFINCD